LLHKKSTVKRRRQDERLNARNRATSQIATAIRRAKSASPEERDAAFRKAVSVIDKAVKTGVLKKETAARKKAGLARAAASTQ